MPLREWNDVPDGAFKMSWSTVDTCQLSPCRIVYKPDGFVPSEAMFFGTVGHGAIEKVTTEKWTIHEAMVTPNILNLAVELASQEDEGNDPFDVMHFLNGHELDWAAEISEAVKRWWTDVWHVEHLNHEVVETEVPRSRYVTDLEPTGRPFWLVTGGIDLISIDLDTGRIRGTDYKLTGSGWWKDKATGRGQDDCYAFLAEEDHGLIEDWDFVVYNRRKREWQHHPTTVTRQSMDAFVERAVGWAQYLTMPDEIRPHLCTPDDTGKRGWWSRPDYNPVWDTCPTCRYLADEYDNQAAPHPDRPWF